MKNIKVLSLGGTISYTAKDGQILGAEDLMSDLAEAYNFANVTYETFISIASSNLKYLDIMRLALRIEESINEGIDGIVVTQGTDTIEETAFMLDLLIKPQIPIIITGAMKNVSQFGYDGISNIISSLKVALLEEVKELGVLVCFNDEIHSPISLRKAHTQNINTFQSEFGPIGWISEGKVRILMQPKSIFKGACTITTDCLPLVTTYTSAFGDNGLLLDYIIPAGYKGLIVEGLGGGHVPEIVAHKLIELAKEIPVILSSRLENGEILTNTYFGYAGSETNLLQNGLISASFLNSRKARVLLTLLLNEGKDKEFIKIAFKKFSEL